MKITVSLKFEGEATVEVPDGLSAEVARLLAENIALSKVIATFDNPDCGEMLEDMFEAMHEKNSITEDQFDSAVAVGIMGNWVVSPQE